jgi:2'-5' RNA ligase
MRLFTGIDLPADVLERLERLLVRIRPAAHLKWTPLHNLHVTTKFIGEWPESQLETLRAALGAVAKRAPITIAIQGLGWFPNPHKPRVFWAGVDGGPALTDLAKNIEQSLEPLGIAPETRPYAPHLTLARVSQPAPLSAIEGIIASLESVEFGAFESRQFYLYRSQTGSAGSVYTKQAEFRFAA